MVQPRLNVCADSQHGGLEAGTSFGVEVEVVRSGRDNSGPQMIAAQRRGYGSREDSLSIGADNCGGHGIPEVEMDFRAWDDVEVPSASLKHGHFGRTGSLRVDLEAS